MKWKLYVFSACLSLSLAANSQTNPATDITNKPFSAQQWTVSTSKQPDGSSTQFTERVDLTRASSGSTRYDYRILSGTGTGPQLQATGSAFVNIRNIPSHLILHLDPDSSIARIALIKPVKNPPAANSLPPGATQSGSPLDLGSQQMSGYTVTGTRQTLLFPKGTLNQTQDVTQTIDTWYSPDLQIPLARNITDSLGNSSAMTVSQIDTSEPDPSSFNLPPNYKTQPANSSVAHQ